MTFLDTLISDHDAAGRPADCTIRVWAEEQKSLLDAIEDPTTREAREDFLRAELVGMPDWKPSWSARGIIAVKDYSEPRKARVQEFYARHIMDSNSPEARFLINDLLQKQNKNPNLLSEQIANDMHTWIEKNGNELRGLSRRLR